MHLIIDQQMVLFYKRVLNSSNVVLQTLLCLKQRSVNSETLALYKFLTYLLTYQIIECLT